VWGDRVFVTTAVPQGDPAPHAGPDSHGAHDNVPPSREQELTVLAVARRSGEILWRTSVRTGRPHESTHETGSWASASPVTDGRRVWAFFGSGGVYALDVEGRVLWQRDLGDMRVLHGHGEGSSPALHGDTLVVNWDHEGDSFLIALDARSGEERWRVPREEPTSWSSPLVVEHGGKTQVVVAATRRVRGYDLATGRLVWECGGLSGNVVATPVAADGLVYAANSYETRNLLAIRLDAARGDVTGSPAVAWERHSDTPYVPSPSLFDETLCFLKHYQNVLTCVNAKSGGPLAGPLRLEGIRNVYASLVGAAGRLYVVDLSGNAVVLRHGGAFEVLARNLLDDSFAASPAIAGRELFLRGDRNLYCIAAD
jgi:outer membrane protein assembly factor BamB